MLTRLIAFLKSRRWRPEVVIYTRRRHHRSGLDSIADQWWRTQRSIFGRRRHRRPLTIANCKLKNANRKSAKPEGRKPARGER